MDRDFFLVHLARERDADDPRGASSTRLELPSSLSFLKADSTWNKEGDPAAALVLEPLPGNTPRLLLVNRSGLDLRVNDRLAPALAVLHERDQFRLGAGPAWQVAVFNRPRIEPPPAGAELRCAVCLDPLESGQPCFWCPGCGAGIHIRTGGEPEEPPCAQEGESCVCSRSICMSERYAHEPDIDRED